MDRAHLAWPIRLGTNGRYVMVEQDSDQDIASCLATCLLWPLGTHESKPEFGITEPNFEEGGPDLEEIREQLEINEPRANLQLDLEDDTLPGMVAEVHAGFNPALGDPDTGGQA